jgi:ribose-phosphate pyrophosphokinase
MKVICTEKSQILGTRLARALKTSVVEVKYSRFPDGEHYLITGELDEETIIVGSVVDNDALVQLLLIIVRVTAQKPGLFTLWVCPTGKRFRKGATVPGPLQRRSAGVSK